MTKPITPKEARKIKKSAIPLEVFEAFNDLIAENISGKYCTVKQDDVVERIIKKLKCERDDIFDKGWLDIEEDYSKAGWSVFYDKPGYCESYDAVFRFEEK